MRQATELGERLTQRLVDAAATAPDDAARRWAQCGALAITVDGDGRPSSRPAIVAPLCDAVADHIGEHSGVLGHAVRLDGAALLAERAAFTAWRPQGSISLGGSCRLMATTAGTLALSLARDSDRALLPAFLGIADDASWEEIERVIGASSAVGLARWGAELGLPCANVGETGTGPLVVTGAIGTAQRSSDVPLVVDLSSLWAGPLAAQIIGLSGAQIWKVESRRRPDGGRNAQQGFYDLLHGGHRSLSFDFDSAHDLAALRRLLDHADVVIEASRPRALEQLGLSYEQCRAAGWRGVWLVITGHGRQQPIRVAFGDDAAVAGGLLAGTSTQPSFCGDAIADPLTGMVAAALTLEALATSWAGRIELSLAATSAFFARWLPHEAGPHHYRPSPPVHRHPSAAAPAIGADNATVRY